MMEGDVSKTHGRLHFWLCIPSVMKRYVMNSSHRDNNGSKFSDEIGRKEKRRLRKKYDKDTSIWFGFGLFGIIGWAVMIPTIIGIAIGVWMDTRYQGGISWTLTFLFIGITLGCLNAWYWIVRERKKIEKRHD